MNERNPIDKDIARLISLGEIRIQELTEVGFSTDQPFDRELYTSMDPGSNEIIDIPSLAGEATYNIMIIGGTYHVIDDFGRSSIQGIRVGIDDMPVRAVNYDKVTPVDNNGLIAVEPGWTDDRLTQ